MKAIPDAPPAGPVVNVWSRWTQPSRGGAVHSWKW
jgi:hypothetical protein